MWDGAAVCCISRKELLCLLGEERWSIGCCLRRDDKKALVTTAVLSKWWCVIMIFSLIHDATLHKWAPHLEVWRGRNSPAGFSIIYKLFLLHLPMSSPPLSFLCTVPPSTCPSYTMDGLPFLTCSVWFQYTTTGSLSFGSRPTLPHYPNSFQFTHSTLWVPPSTRSENFFSSLILVPPDAVNLSWTHLHY